jgi:hypothetical protein
MRDLLERLSELRREATEGEVNQLLSILGETTSIPVLEAVLKHYKEQEKAILTGDLLEWMRENDLEKFENEDVRVDINTYVSAKVEDPDSAFRWLEENQYGDLIKDTLDFPKGEFTPEAEHLLSELGVSYSKKSGIHPQSLKKIISDRLKAGEDIPTEDAGIKVNFYDECRVKERG